ncbi:MAG: hypothetical protein ACM3VT_11020 [Solirubrobacterales bacterium]
MNYDTSMQRTARSRPYRPVTIPLIDILLVAATGIAFVWLMIEPTYVVSGTVRIIPVMRTMDEADPLDTFSYEQFMNTQAVLLLSDEKQLQRIGDDVAGRRLAFFSGKPASRMGRLIFAIFPRDSIWLPSNSSKRARPSSTRIP